MLDTNTYINDNRNVANWLRKTCLYPFVEHSLRDEQLVFQQMRLYLLTIKFNRLEDHNVTK